MFVDEAKILVRGGHGGNGCVWRSGGTSMCRGEGRREAKLLADVCLVGLSLHQHLGATRHVSPECLAALNLRAGHLRLSS